MPELIDPSKLKQILEAALMAADEPLTVDRLARLFAHGELDSEDGRAQLRDTLAVLEAECVGRGYELLRVASGYRYQVRQELSEWVSLLWDEKPPRYTRALLETLALIAYKQPVTRGDIEQVRGVAVSPNILRTLVERGWIRVVGQREVPGKPSLYGTTRAFLDYFALKSLDQLPPLAEIRSLIEPLVVDEVVEVARKVGLRDHPELAAMDETWQGAGSGDGEPTEEASATSHDERQIDPRFASADADGSYGDSIHEGSRETSFLEASSHEGSFHEAAYQPFVDEFADDEFADGEGGVGDGQEEAAGHQSNADEEAGERQAEVGRISVDDIGSHDRNQADREAPSAEILRLPVPPRR